MSISTEKWYIAREFYKAGQNNPDHHHQNFIGGAEAEVIFAKASRVDNDDDYDIPHGAVADELKLLKRRVRILEKDRKTA